MLKKKIHSKTEEQFLANICFKILKIPGNLKESNKIPYSKNLETTTYWQWLLILSLMRMTVECILHEYTFSIHITKSCNILKINTHKHVWKLLVFLTIIFSILQMIIMCFCVYFQCLLGWGGEGFLKGFTFYSEIACCITIYIIYIFAPSFLSSQI